MSLPAILCEALRKLLSSESMTTFGMFAPRNHGRATPNSVRPTCGFANDSWEPAAIAWWGGEP